MKLKSIFALIGVLALVSLYLSTLVFALMKRPESTNLLMVSIMATIFIPCIIYGMQVMARGLSNNPKAIDEEDKEAGGK